MSTTTAYFDFDGKPEIGQFMRWADIALIDRSDTASAVAALQPVVDRPCGRASGRVSRFAPDGPPRPLAGVM